MNTTSTAEGPIQPHDQASLKKRVARGAAWTSVRFAIFSVTRLGSNLILTRLLVPEAFGLVGITIMVQFLVNMMSDIGIKSSVIRSENAEDPQFISTAWVLQMARGLLMAAIISLAAGAIYLSAQWSWVPASTIYADPRVPLFIMFGAVSAIIQGTHSIKFLLADRNLMMGRVTILQIIAQLLSTLITIGIAFVTQDPIALAIGLLISPIVLAFGSHLFIEGPAFSIRLKREYLDEMLTFGVWILVASLFTFFIQRGAQFSFGFLLNATEFSFLSIALIWINVLMLSLSNIQNRVALPAFSETRRQNPADQTRIYYRMRIISDGLAILASLGALFIAGPILDFVYTEEYDRVIFYVQLLSLSVLFIPYEMLDNVLLSDGASRQFSFVKFLTATVILAGIPLAYRSWGAEAAIIFSSMAPAVGIPLRLYYGRKTIKIVLWREALLMVLAGIGLAYLLLR